MLVLTETSIYAMEVREPESSTQAGDEDPKERSTESGIPDESGNRHDDQKRGLLAAGVLQLELWFLKWSTELEAFFLSCLA